MDMRTLMGWKRGTSALTSPPPPFKKKKKKANFKLSGAGTYPVSLQCSSEEEQLQNCKPTFSGVCMDAQLL